MEIIEIVHRSLRRLTFDISGRRRAQPFDCPLDGMVRALFGEVHGGAHFGSFCEHKHTLPNVPPARQIARANPCQSHGCEPLCLLLGIAAVPRPPRRTTFFASHCSERDYATLHVAALAVTATG